MSMHKELSVKSRVRGDFHARFCERVRVKLPRSTRPAARSLCPYTQKDAASSLVIWPLAALSVKCSAGVGVIHCLVGVSFVFLPALYLYIVQAHRAESLYECRRQACVGYERDVMVYRPASYPVPVCQLTA